MARTTKYHLIPTFEKFEITTTPSSMQPLSMPQQQADQVACVLQLLLSAAADWDIKTICSLLQVSTACRTAVFESGVCVEVCAEKHLRTRVPSRWVSQVCTQRLAQFCAWLPCYASLVRKLIMSPPPDKDLASYHAPRESFSLAVQLSAQPAVAPPAAAAVQGSPAGQRVSAAGLATPLQRLQLQSLDTGLQLQPAALAALASCSSLTALSMRASGMAWYSNPSLALLTNLQRLYVSDHSPRLASQLPVISHSFATAVAQLHQLTYLECDGKLSPASLQDLPAQLSVLKVLVSNHPVARMSYDVSTTRKTLKASLQHMSALKQLQLEACGGEALLQATLPTRLIALTTVAGAPVQIIPESLPNLSELRVGVEGMDILEKLRVFPKLTLLEVSCRRMASAGQLSAALAGAVVSAVATATHIKSLALHRADTRAGSFVAPAAGDSCMELADCVGRLTQLSKLTVSGFVVQPADMLKLTVLSGLVSLSVLECPALGDTAAAAVACKQTGLTALQLQGCGLQSPGLLSALAGCTSLRELDLRGNELPVCDESLLLLTALRQLTQLVLPAAASTVSADGLQQFKAAMPQLQSLQVL